MVHEDRYLDDRTLTRWTLGLLWARIFVAGIALFSGYFERDLLVDMQTGEFESEAALMSAAMRSDGRERIIGTTQLLLFIACGTAILMWVYRCCHNVRVRAPRLEVTPAATVGWYFIPIANYWKPYTAMREVWGAAAEQAGKSWNSDRGLLRTWWILFIVRSLLGAGVLAATSRAKEIDELIAANSAIAWVNASTIALCAVFIVMVNRMRSMQSVAFSSRTQIPQPDPSSPGEPRETR